MPIRIGVALAITLLLVPTLTYYPTPIQEITALGIAVMRELVIGLGMGFVVSIVFNAIYVAGQLIDVPMGFGMVSVLDPNIGIQVPIVAQFLNIFATLMFFAIGGPRIVILVLGKSFQLVPLGPGPVSSAIASVGLEAFIKMFLIGVTLSLPAVAALLLTDIALGILARVVPQINVFIVGFPLKIGVGLLILALGMPVYIWALAGLFASDGVIWTYVERFLRSFL